MYVLKQFAEAELSSISMNKLSKSILKFILGEKSRISQKASGIKEQYRLINELYQKFN